MRLQKVIVRQYQSLFYKLNIRCHSICLASCKLAYIWANRDHYMRPACQSLEYQESMIAHHQLLCRHVIEWMLYIEYYNAVEDAIDSLSDVATRTFGFRCSTDFFVKTIKGRATQSISTYMTTNSMPWYEKAACTRTPKIPRKRSRPMCDGTKPAPATVPGFFQYC